MNPFYKLLNFTYALLLLLSSSVLPQNILSIRDTTIEISSKFWIEVHIENRNDVVGFQFDITFPNEVVYLDSIILGTRFTDHIVSNTPIANKEISILSFSLSNSQILDSKGLIVKLLCKTGMDVSETTISITNAILASENGTNVLDSIKNGIIKISNPVSIKVSNIPIKSNNTNKISVYPNPFNNSTIINYFSNTLNQLELTTFSIDGRVIKRVNIVPSNIGQNEEIINMSSLATGMYILKLQNNESISAAKVLLLK